MLAKKNTTENLIRLGVVTYIIALSLIAAFTIAFHFLTDSIVHQQQKTAQIVNISGRQRMLSQRIAKIVLERATHYNMRSGAESEQALRAAIDLMETSHHALLYGSPDLGLSGPSSPAVRDVYLKPPFLLDLRMQDFLLHARALRDRPDAQLTLDDPDLLAVEQAAKSPLLDALDAAVTANQQTSEAAIGNLRKVLTSLTLLMLLLLMLEAIFLYRPLFNRLARAHLELIEAGRTDPLTGCLNRRAFTQEAHGAVARARELSQPLAVLMLDIDRFKNVNDRHGHPVGDRVINSVVGTLLKTIRTTDVLCRMGGEEFAIMLPSETIDSAAETAERIRAAIAGRTISLSEDGFSFLKITISIGVAILEPTDASLFDVLGRADKALYRAKASGRNRFETETGPYLPTQIEEMNLLRRSRV